MKILVIQQKMIGDVLASTVICDNLKKHLPHSEIHYLINDTTLDVIRHHKSLDAIVVFKSAYKNNFGAFFAFLKQIRKERYDAVIDVYGKLESNLITLASGASIRVSYKKWYTSWIYSHLFTYGTKAQTPQGLAIENRLLLLSPLLDDIQSLKGRPGIVILEKEREAVIRYLADHGLSPEEKLVMVSIQGSGPNKSYPLPYMAQLLNAAIGHANATYLFNYTPEQEGIALELFQNIRPELRNRIRMDLKPGSLRFFLTLLSRCDALIGNEGGPMNMGKALNIPTFSIFSPWIAKEAWYTFNDEPQNKAVHLRDFTQEPFKNKGQKELKKEAEALYLQFRPELIEDKLLKFLDSEVFAKQ